MRKVILSLLSGSIFSGCLSATLERDEGEIKTVGYYTGSFLSDEGIYHSQFVRGATKACSGKSYEILERTRNPSTLSGMELPSSKFYWVIRCK